MVDDWQVSIFVVATATKGCVGIAAELNPEPTLNLKLLILPSIYLVVCTEPLPIVGGAADVCIVPPTVVDATSVVPTNIFNVPDTLEQAM